MPSRSPPLKSGESALSAPAIPAITTATSTDWLGARVAGRSPPDSETKFTLGSSIRAWDVSSRKMPTPSLKGCAEEPALVSFSRAAPEPLRTTIGRNAAILIWAVAATQDSNSQIYRRHAATPASPLDARKVLGIEPCKAMRIRSCSASSAETHDRRHLLFRRAGKERP